MTSLRLAGVALAALAVGAILAFGFGWSRAAQTVLLVGLFVTGSPLVARTVLGLVRGRFAADVVAMLAIVTAMAIGEAVAGLVIVLMQSGGESLEHYAFRRASRSLEHLLARAPRIARLVTADGTREVPVAEVRVGDLLAVRPGDLVPVDATVVGGASHVDQSALTGEPEPIGAGVGTALMSGSVNLEGALSVRATRVASESQYQVIVRLVERARAERPPIQRLADRWAVWFTPATLVMCGVAWWLAHDWSTVLAVLVVATPCPLILATPVAVMAGIGRAARAGIIVKTGSAIEQIGRARAVAFDKTGTLTLGRPSVAAIMPDEGEPDRLLRFAAAVEQLSSHHLGAAIVAAAHARGLALPQPERFAETPGAGVEGVVDGHQVRVGTAAYAGAVTGDHRDTTAWVAVDGRAAGHIRFHDQVRDGAADLVRRLAHLGVRHQVLLTGDRLPHARAVGAAVGITDVRAELLPADKVEAVGRLRRDHPGEVVVMVGDGINDAPALAAAGVGVAMGAHAPAAAAEAADIVLLVDDVTRVGEAVAIGRRTRAVALQSIGFGLGVSAVLMVVAALGHIPPTVGALLQEGLDVAVIMNALRAAAD